ncbi:hypothetical protein PROFUN_03769 [Planoprotostelium fungivorum]|uniref:Fibronectin type-III domain-containing protein n=1 Tax=Planoprotostelium fungivorum TaxID=1890364 RepID=A0A2P6NDP5_9EUKA|nr:hypothetical protein PROFUN_03769 [Planoprotostelium fungivorum]
MKSHNDDDFEDTRAIQLLPNFKVTSASPAQWLFLLPVQCNSADRDALLAYFASRSYSDATDHQWTYQGKCHRFTFLNTMDSPLARGDLFASSSLGWAIISFRGTVIQNLNNDLTDIDAAQIPCQLNGAPCGNVHSGFFSAFEDLGQFRTRIPRDLDKYKIFVTGHSLGGALAVLYSLDRLTQGQNVDGLVTFGQPRVGDAEFISTFQSYGVDYVRYVKTYGTQQDVVTSLPPGWPDMGERQDVDCTGCGGMFAWGPFNWLTLHSMSGYVDVLRSRSQSAQNCAMQQDMEMMTLSVYDEVQYTLSNVDMGTTLHLQISSPDTVSVCVFVVEDTDYSYTSDRDCGGDGKRLLLPSSNGYEGQETTYRLNDDSYVLVLENHNAYRSAEITWGGQLILPVPSSPSNVKAQVLSSSQVQLRWNRPDDSGYPYEITHYVVEYSGPADGGYYSFNVSVNEVLNDQLTVEGLDTHILYQFTLSAFNSRFYSTPSTTAMAFTHNIPSDDVIRSMQPNVTRTATPTSFRFKASSSTGWIYFSGDKLCTGAFTGKVSLNQTITTISVREKGKYYLCYGGGDAAYDVEFAVQSAVPLLNAGWEDFSTMISKNICYS